MNHIRHLEELLGLLHEQRYRLESEDDQADGCPQLNALWRHIRNYEAELEALKIAQWQARTGKSLR
jgi:hypothetical protein